MSTYSGSKRIGRGEWIYDLSHRIKRTWLRLDINEDTNIE